MCARCGNFVRGKVAAALENRDEAALRRRVFRHKGMSLMKDVSARLALGIPGSLGGTRGKDSVRGLLQSPRAIVQYGVSVLFVNLHPVTKVTSTKCNDFQG